LFDFLNVVQEIKRRLAYTHRDRQTDRQTDRQSEREREREIVEIAAMM